MPPSSAALSWPPKRLPLTETAIASMPTIGFRPASSSPTSIRMPSIAPENSRFGIPWIDVTAADMISVKSSGWACGSVHWMPSWVIRMGSQDGHLNALPSAPPRLRTTPKPCLALNEPSPVKLKLRASPPIISDPIFTSAPTAAKETRSSVGPAPVLILKSVAVIVRTEPSVSRSVSASNRNALTLPSAPKSMLRRIASVFLSCAVSLGSGVRRSRIVAETGLPGRNFTPPDAT